VTAPYSFDVFKERATATLMRTVIAFNVSEYYLLTTLPELTGSIFRTFCFCFFGERAAAAIRTQAHFDTIRAGAELEVVFV
jgi:hypothetical protein